MTAVHASFPIRYEHRAGARDCSVLEERYDSIRPDIVVDMPVRLDRYRGSLQASVGLYEKIWVDPVYAIIPFFDIDYSSALASCLDQRLDVEQSYTGGSEIWLGSHNAYFAEGQAVCLWQSFEVVQSYLGGTESWASSHQVDFANGEAVCLWHTFEVIQSYLGGTEAWASSHQVDFALGRAVCLWQSFEVIQGYLGGSEAWTSSHEQFFALGRSVCLYQNYQIDQPYVGGNEHWPILYDSFFSSGSSIALVQSIDVIQPYTGGQEDWTFCYDRIAPSVTAQMFLVGTESTEIAGLGVAFVGVYEMKTIATTEFDFALDSIVIDRVFSAVSRNDCCRYFYYLASAATDEVDIDAFSGRPRSLGSLSTFHVIDMKSFGLFGRYDFTETALACFPSAFDRSNAGRFLLRLQEEVFFVFIACLTNIHTGLVTIAETGSLTESVKSLESKCSGDARWQMEYETTARFYSPDQPDQVREQALWRFETRSGKHWKQGPVVSDVRAIKLPSFMELHFSADWPYRSLELQINAYQFQPTEDGDWFDLGVWISDSARIDTDEGPLLTIPYASETRNYDVHVPRQETTRYIGIAPIRRFPYEEIGALSVIYVP